jgi:glycosyltransferase involved in cell wall biosynthesis
MKIAFIHNYYQQPGGEDQVFAAEADLLEARGHQIVRYVVYNDQIAEMGKASLMAATIWNQDSVRKLRRLFRSFDAEVAHFHNTLPLISPAGYYAARAEGLSVVQTLHNYRLLCPAATFLRNGQVCEDCLGKSVAWPGVLHGCYRQSRAATGAVATMLTAHHILGTWRRTVDVYIALTTFAKAKFIKGGLPSNRIIVKPNFINPDPGPGDGAGGYALFVGRLSPEKGIATLLSAWERFQLAMPLRIVGDGPLAREVAVAASRLTNVEWLGRQSKERVLALYKKAAFLILPSIWYEGFPMVIAESFAAGLPVVASNLGAPGSIIEHNRTGRLFCPGDAEDLAAQITWLSDHPAELMRMRLKARSEYEAKYTAEQNYTMLMDIYARARANRNCAQ